MKKWSKTRGSKNGIIGEITHRYARNDLYCTNAAVRIIRVYNNKHIKDKVTSILIWKNVEKRGGYKRAGWDIRMPHYTPAV